VAYVVEWHVTTGTLKFVATKTDKVTGLNIDLDESEADLDGRTFQWPESGEYFTGLEVFHSLHCLVCVPSRINSPIYSWSPTESFASSALS
jgi:hypothetical protein